MRSDYEIVERHDLTEAEWRRIAPLLPAPAARGRRPQDRRPILNGILWMLATGASWRDLPPRYPPWQTCHYYFRRWQREGVWDRLHRALQRTLRSEYNAVDFALFCVDSTIVRAHRAAAGAGGKPAPGRAARPRARAQPRRLQHQALPGH
jgi:transposase